MLHQWRAGLVYAATAALLLTHLTGCVGFGGVHSRSVLSQDGAPKRDVDVSHVEDAVPKLEPVTRAGNRSPYTVLGKTYHVNFNAENFAQSGYASWYGTKFHGNKTANGEVYDMYAMTAAHKTLPIPSYARVTNVENGRQVLVRINDRGPFHDGRIVDLSYAAAKKLGILAKGTGKVLLEVVTAPGAQRHAQPAAQVKSNQAVASMQTYLQVGAFTHERSAASLKRKLLPLTNHAIVIVSDLAKPLYKVLVGPVANKQDLLALKKALGEASFIETYAVEM